MSSSSDQETCVIVSASVTSVFIPMLIWQFTETLRYEIPIGLQRVRIFNLLQSIGEPMKWMMIIANSTVAFYLFDIEYRIAKEICFVLFMWNALQTFYHISLTPFPTWIVPSMKGFIAWNVTYRTVEFFIRVTWNPNFIHWLTLVFEATFYQGILWILVWQLSTLLRIVRSHEQSRENKGADPVLRTAMLKLISILALCVFLIIFGLRMFVLQFSAAKYTDPFGTSPLRAPPCMKVIPRTVLYMFGVVLLAYHGYVPKRSKKLKATLVAGSYTGSTRQIESTTITVGSETA